MEQFNIHAGLIRWAFHKYERDSGAYGHLFFLWANAGDFRLHGQSCRWQIERFVHSIQRLVPTHRNYCDQRGCRMCHDSRTDREVQHTSAFVLYVVCRGAASVKAARHNAGWPVVKSVDQGVNSIMTVAVYLQMTNFSKFLSQYANHEKNEIYNGKLDEDKIHIYERVSL